MRLGASFAARKHESNGHHQIERGTHPSKIRKGECAPRLVFKLSLDMRPSPKGIKISESNYFVSQGLKKLSQRLKRTKQVYPCWGRVMSKNLTDALKDAKTRRGVFSKTIIWESGVSKSQFYRIIKGEEAPSVETKQRILGALGLTDEEFDALFEQSKNSSPVQNALTDAAVTSKANPKNNTLLIGFAATMFLVGVGIVVVNSLPKENNLSGETTVAVPDDKTLFIKDVTIPDGTAIPVNTTFVKTWRVKNVGNVVWKDRYLKRMTPLSGLICSSPAMVPIPETQPGETVDLSVTFKTPHLPGSCRTDWKTSDDRGNLYFPDMHGLFSIVTVVEK